MLLLLIVGAVAIGGFYIGKRGKEPATTPNKSLQNNIDTSNSYSPTSTPKPTRLISGGVSKEGGLAFDQFSLEVPVDWSIERKTPAPASEELAIIKGAYELKIFQAATGGALCLYPGDPDFEGPSSRYSLFAELTTQDARILRRSGSDAVGNTGKVGYTICQRNTEGSFNQPTSYGHISFSLPKNYDKEILGEMDAMIICLKKQ